MSLKERIEADLKTALIGGDKTKVTILRGLKSAILNVEIAKNKRDSGLDDQEVTEVLAKESKKRQESADLYEQGGDQTRRDAELFEKALIDGYLPEKMSDEDLDKIITDTISELGADGPSALGQVISAVRQKVGSQADGGTIAAKVKEKLS